MKLRAIAGILLALCSIVAAPSVAAEEEDPVVVIGFSGLLWRDVTEESTPNLYKFVEDSSGANMVVRTVEETTCPTEGWLTVGAGQRAIDPVNGCQKVGEGDWAGLKEANQESSYRAELGLLGDTLQDQDVAAVGPGAKLALTNSAGEFTGEYSDNYADVAGSDLITVDLGAIRYPGDELSSHQGDEYRPRGAIDKFLAAFKGTDAPPPEVVPQIEELDARFGELMTEVPPNAKILVTSVGDAQEAAPQLGFMAVRDGEGLASSDATRQPGLVQLTDVFPTIVSWLEPDAPVLERVVGSEIRGGDGVVDVASRLADDQERSENVRPFVGPFYVGVLLLAAVTGLAAWRVLRRGGRVRGLGRFAAWVASLPVASLLINVFPWWRFAVPWIALFAGMGLIAGLIVAVAYMVPRRDKVEAPIAIIGAITALTLIIDVLADTVTSHYPLQLASLLGTQPQVGGRFYGLSNASFAIMAVGLLLAASYVAARVRWGGVFLAVVGVAAILIDGSATLGADFGGPPALVVGFVLAGLLIYRVRLTPWWVLGTLLAAGATSLVFSVIDYLRPAAERSHLGRFIQTVIDGGGFEVITRKLSQSLFGLPWWMAVSVFVLAGVVAIWWWYHHTPRPEKEEPSIPLLRHTAFPIIATLVFGMVINDSGVVIPAIGLTVAGLGWAAMSLKSVKGREVLAGTAGAEPVRDGDTA